MRLFRARLEVYVRGNTAADCVGYAKECLRDAASNLDPETNMEEVVGEELRALVRSRTRRRQVQGARLKAGAANTAPLFEVSIL